MEIGSLIILFLIAAVGAAWLALPFVRGRGGAVSAVAQARVTLVNDYARVVASLRDLEEDHTTGKLDDAAYEDEKVRLTEQGVQYLARLDKEGLLPASASVGDSNGRATSPGKGTAADQALDEALEAAIARYASVKAKG